MPFTTLGLLSLLLTITSVDSQNIVSNSTTTSVPPLTRNFLSESIQTHSIGITASSSLVSDSTSTVYLSNSSLTPSQSQTTHFPLRSSEAVVFSSSALSSSSLSSRDSSPITPTAIVPTASPPTLPAVKHSVRTSTPSVFSSPPKSSSQLIESPEVFMSIESKQPSSSKMLSISLTPAVTMSFSITTVISPTSVLETVPPVHVTTTVSHFSVAELSPTPTTSPNVTSILNFIQLTSTVLPSSTQVSSTIKMLESPTPSVDNMQSGLFYIGVAVGLAVVLVALTVVSVLSFYFCCRSKKYEYSTGNAVYRVTVQRYNPNKEHYTAGSDSAFSSRGSSVRSSFGGSSKTRKASFTSADHVTSIINLEMFSTPM